MAENGFLHFGFLLTNPHTKKNVNLKDSKSSRKQDVFV